MHFLGTRQNTAMQNISHSDMQHSSDWRLLQRRGSILAWSAVILSVHGVDTIAIDLSLSALIS
jgi:hypothetical protein